MVWFTERLSDADVRDTHYYGSRCVRKNGDVRPWDRNSSNLDTFSSLTSYFPKDSDEDPPLYLTLAQNKHGQTTGYSPVTLGAGLLAG